MLLATQIKLLFLYSNYLSGQKRILQESRSYHINFTRVVVTKINFEKGHKEDGKMKDIETVCTSLEDTFSLPSI